MHTRPVPAPDGARAAVLPSGPPPPPRPPSRAAAATLLDLVLRASSVEDQLEQVARAAASVSPDVGGSGITARRSGRVVSVATSHPLVDAVDELQYRARQGPCLQTLASGEQLVVRDYADEPRWPGYASHAFAQGVRSSLSLPMQSDGRTVGALNSYGLTPDVFVGDVHDALLELATTAANVVAVALRHAEQSDILDHLHAAMESRSVVDQALGVLMAQQRCTADEAFALLRQASQGRNRKVADIATSIVASVSGGPPRTGRFTA